MLLLSWKVRKLFNFNLEGEREVTLGFVDLMRDAYIEKDRSRGIYFTQDWCGMGGTIPVAMWNNI